MRLKNLAAVAVILLSGCANFNYGEPFKEPEPSEDKATLVFFESNWPNSQIPVAVAVDGRVVASINPQGYKVVPWKTFGKQVFHTSSRMVDLRRIYDIRPGEIYYMRVHCYGMPVGHYCRIEPIPRVDAFKALTTYRESVGIVGDGD